MSGWVPPRLRPLLAADLGSIDADRLRHVIGISEAVDLDFKRDPWATTEGGAKEAAYDVAAMANSAGGLILVGVDEDGSGNASEFVGVQTTTDLALWVHQVVAGRVAPPPTVAHAVVDIDGKPVHAFAVEPSSSGPHAVAVGDGALRYPTRTGSLRRYLSEAEVADRYRRRFAAVAGITGRLDEILGAVTSVTQRHRDGARARAWLALGLVPGEVELRRGVEDEWRHWISLQIARHPCFGPRGLNTATFGFRSIDVHDGFRDGPSLVAGRLWSDGSGLMAFGYRGGQGAEGVPDEVVAIYDEFLVGDIVNGLDILASHAVRSGASGLANLTARVGWTIEHAHLALAEPRSGFPGVIEGLRTVPETGVSRRSVPLDVLLEGRSRLGAVRLIAGDHRSSFGWPEPQQITADLQLVRYQTMRDHWAWLDRWASENGVEVIDHYDR